MHAPSPSPPGSEESRGDSSERRDVSGDGNGSGDAKGKRENLIADPCAVSGDGAVAAPGDRPQNKPHQKIIFSNVTKNLT